MTRPSRPVLAAAVALLLALPLAGSLAPAADAPLAFQEFTVPEKALCEVRDLWIERLLAEHPEGTWAPMRVELTDEMLALLGLPPRAFLEDRRFPEPTMVSPDGTMEVVDLAALSTTQGTLGPTVGAYAGTGCVGIRPGAFLLLLDGGVGWCSLAHVYGSPGSYQASTAGHCGQVGDRATVVAAFGNRDSVLNPILLDFGKFEKGQDGGLGSDWALLSVDAPWQGLVSPTMCFWGGPLGTYTKVGETVAVDFPRNGKAPSLTTDTDPHLVQTIVHYGHGTGVGAGGTPRAGTAIAWGTDHFMFVGAISPGDSGSASNALGGDAVGSVNEAAGINTHLYVDPLLRQGVGIMGGTRVTEVPATLANGQVVPWPAPFPLGP